MTNNKIVKVIELKGELSSLERDLSVLRQSLSGLQLPKSVEKAFGGLDEIIKTLQGRVAEGIVSREEFKIIEREVGQVTKQFGSLVGSLKTMQDMSKAKKLSLLPEDTQAKLKAAADAMTGYSATLSNLIKLEKEYTAAKEREAAITAKVAAAEANESAAKRELEAIQKRIDKQAELTAALEDQRNAKKLLEDAEKEVEKAKLRGMGEQAIKNREAKARSAAQNLEGANMVVTFTKEGIDPDELRDYEDAVEQLTEKTKKYKDANQLLTDILKSQTEAKGALATIETQLKQSAEDGAQGTKEQKEAYTALLNAIKQVKPEFKDVAKEGETTTQKLERLGKIVESLSEEEIQKLNISLESLSGSADGAKKTVTTLSDSLQQIKDETKSSDEEMGKVQDLEKRIKAFLGIQGAVEVMRRAMRDALSTIVELDKQMAQMAVVTDLSIGDYWDQLPEYSQRASELGVSINSAYEAATLYYQQGLKTNEVNAISAETLKMAKIAGLDAASATDKMTAALRGFNMELNETSAQRVSDVYSELAAITAADTKEIANAMTKTASIASSAGMEFETTAAFLSQIIETTRESAETAGTAMKTVIARFQELKKDPGEIGEVEGEIVDANAIETALRSVGVALRDSSGQFRELDDVFLELSSKWDGLDKNTRRYIATIAAGSRQQSRFIAMMQDYKRTTELVTAANTSAGASQKQFEKTMESLEAKVEKLKNAWHEFTMGIMNSDLVKVGVDILTKFLEIINKATSAFNGLGGSITKIVGVLTVFKIGQTIFEKLKAPLVNFFAEIIKQAGITGEKAAREAIEGVNRVQQQNQTQTAESTPKKKKGITTIYSNFINGVSSLSKSRKSKKEAFKLQTQAELLAPDAKRAEQQTEQAKTELADIQNKKEEVSSQLNTVKSTRAKKGEAETKKNTIASLTKQLEELQSEEDALQKKTEELTKTTQNYYQVREKQAEAENKATQQAREGWASIGESIGTAGAALAGFGTAISMVGGLFSSIGLEGFGETLSTVGNAAMMLGGLLTALVPIFTLLSKVVQVENGKMMVSFMGLNMSLGVIGIIILVIMAAVIAILAITNAIKKNSPTARLQKMQEAADEAAEAAEEAKEAFEGLVNALDELDDKYDALDELTQGTKEWNKAIQEINAGILDLIEQYPELAALVKNEGGVLKLDIDSEEVQDVVGKYEKQSINASIAATGAKVATAQAKRDVAYGNLNRKERIGAADAYGDAEGTFEGNIKKRKRARTDAVARALAEGWMYEEDGTFKATEGSERNIKELGLDPDALGAFDNEVYKSADNLKEYGKTLKQIDTETAAYYDSLAIASQQLIDLSNKTQQELDQINATATGEDFKKILEDERAKYVKKTRADGKNVLYNDSVTNDAFEKYMVESGRASKVKKVKDDTIVYFDKEGKKQTVDKEVIMNEMINYNASQELANRQENINAAIDAAAVALAEWETAQLSRRGQWSEERKASAEGQINDAIQRLFQDADGGKLLQQDLTNLKRITDEELRTIYKGLDPALQDAFGTVDDFVAQFTSTVNKATETFNNYSLKEKDFSFMDAGLAQAFSKKLAEVSSLAGGEEAAKSIKTETARLLGEITDDEVKREIQSRINMTDWSSLEDLKSLQLDLMYEYGLGQQETQDYINAISAAAYSTSRLTTVVQTYGDFWKASQKVNQSITKTSHLMWEFNRAIENNEEVTSKSIENIISEYRDQASGYLNMQAASNDDLAKIYAQGAINYKVDLTDFVKLGDNGLEIDSMSLQDAINTKKVTQDEADKWIKSLQAQYDKSQEALEGAREALENIEKLEDQSHEAYMEITDLVEDTITKQLQEQITLQEETLDATQTANSKLIEKIQEQIDKTRQDREKDKAQQNIADLQQQSAYLGMDTSGANALQVLDLGTQIDEAEQSYQDTLIDQALQNLSDANEKAAEQRERQIELAQQQLDIYTSSSQFQEMIQQETASLLQAGNEWLDSSLGQAIQKNVAAGMSTEQATEWAASIGSSISLATLWKGTDWDQYKTDTKGYIETIEQNVAALAEKATGSAVRYSGQDLATKLQGRGFDLAKAGMEYDSKTNTWSDPKGFDGAASKNMEALNTFVNNEGDTSDSEKYAKENGLLSKNQYYGQMTEAIIAGEADTYNDYVKIQKARQGIIDKARAGGLTSTEIKELEEDYIKADENVTNEEKEKLRQEFYNKLIGTGGEYKGQLTDLDVGPLGYLRSAKLKEERIGGPAYYKVTDATILTQLETLLAREGIQDTSQAAVNLGEDSYFRMGKDQNWYRLIVYDADEEVWSTDWKTRFKTGGLADFTGPAWLDGTPSKPEYVLNAQQTERFFSLIDVLEGYDASKGEQKSSGDNYFDISINVEKLDNDYDVEKVADKIRRMIYDDATYRNVNAINHIR